MGIPHRAGHSLTGLLLLCLPLVLPALGGCTRAPIPAYGLSEKSKTLPEPHQKQISEGLTRLFGTSSNPRFTMLAVAEPAEEETAETEATDEEAVDAAEKTDEKAGSSEQKAKPPLTCSSLDLQESVPQTRLRNGALVYRERCAGCHGLSGDGQGEAAPYLVPKPRDYRNGIFKFTSTPYGMKPARADLVRTIRRGAKGTSMPSFPWMSEEDLQDVIDYVILLSQRGEIESFVVGIAEADYEAEDRIEDADFAEAIETVQTAWSSAEAAVVQPVSAPPAYDDASISKGRAAFLSRGCSKCHGEEGNGQTEWLSSEFHAAEAAKPEADRAQINFDVWGQPAPAADLTARMLHGGRRPLDIYRRIHTGISGTPMPAFGDALAAEPETIWNLVHYVLSIVEGRQPKQDATAAAPVAEEPAEESTAESADAPAEEQSVPEPPAAETLADPAPAATPTATDPPAPDPAAPGSGEPAPDSGT
jgi:mono/diheme cytochrome c family protein